MNTTYYVYSVSHKITGKWYIGSRTAKGSHPDELFRPSEKYIEGKSKGHKKGYFTSSKYVKHLMKLDGGIKNFKVESVKIFDTKEKALFCEALLHKLFDIAKDNDYLNLHNQGSKFTTGITHSEETRRKISEANKRRTHSEETRRKMSLVRKGRIHSEEAKKKLSEAHKGKTLSEETRRKMSLVRKGKYKGENSPFYGKKLSEETRRKISESRRKYKGENSPFYGNRHSEETRRKISEAFKGIPRQKITCPHCNKTGGVNNMKRWHFDNCKNNPNK